MSIQYHEASRIFTLHTAHTTYQMQAGRLGTLLHLYYGARVPDALDYLLTYADRGFSANPPEAGADRTYSLDALPQEYPTLGTGDCRAAALVVRDAAGAEGCSLHYVSHTIRRGKYALAGLPAVYAAGDEAETLEVLLRDELLGLEVRLLYGVLEAADIITRSVRITNAGAGELTLEKAASACLDFLDGGYDLITLYGRHAMERNVQRAPVGHGCSAIGSRRGASSHQYNPGVVLAAQDATETAGACYGMLFVYSGSFLCEAEQDQYNQTRLLMGLQSEGFHYPLAPGESFTVPETILSYAADGLDRLSRQYHDCIRSHLCRGPYRDAPRPVVVNSWEAQYFAVDAPSLLRLAREAAAVGADMLVLDDGWFGQRDDDDCGLGDWVVNERKLGCTLGELTAKVNALGLRFGLWVEPEMVSEDSGLYRAHPDWALRIPGRAPVRGRSQLVLDFTRAEVREAVFAQICAVLDSAHVEYLKWDMNRSLAELCSARTAPGRVAYDYVLGVYDFLERLLRRYPGLLIEGCSGGGGRFDAGMLYYTPQIWCSDNTDALDRLRIQYGTSLFYPLSTMGAHVTSVPNHQTGRTVSLHTRGVVAMSGAFGYELDLCRLPEAEKAEIKAQITRYRACEALLRTGSYHRLTDPARDACAAWQVNAADGSRALLSIVVLALHGNMPVSYLRLRGLAPGAVYEDAATGRRYSGAALMQAGLPVPVELGAYRAYQIELARV